MQEAFRANLPKFPEVANRIALAAKGAQLLGVPIIVTEQYPKGLGHTVAEILEVLPKETSIIDKTSFSSCGAQRFQDELRHRETKQVFVCGIEAHICVNQTVHDLLQAGQQVHLLTDCITSRTESDCKTAIEKMKASGVILSTLEMALFELMRDAKHEQFKTIQGLIK